MSDFGLLDPYVAIVKGVIHALAPSVLIIDLTHEIQPQDIRHGAFILNYSYRDFPKGAIFLAVIDPGVGSQRAGLIVQCRKSLFLGPDNGLLGPIIQNHREATCFKIDPRRVRQESERLGVRLGYSHTFHARDLFGPSAALLSRGIGPKEIGKPYNEPKSFVFPEPKLSTTSIEGQIIYIDRFGNAISNIPSSLLDELICPNRERPVVITSDHGFPLPFHTTYSQVKRHAPLFLENSYGLIEIAVNRGSAQQELGIKIGDKIQIKCRRRKGA